MSPVIELQKPIAPASTVNNASSIDTTSSVELFSYLLCCALQGAVGVVCFACLTLVPIAIRQGLLSHGLG